MTQLARKSKSIENRLSLVQSHSRHGKNVALYTVVSRLGSFALVGGILFGVQHMIEGAGHTRQLLQSTALLGVFGLTIAFSVRAIGFRYTFSSLIRSLSALGESHPDYDASIGTWAMLSANVIAVLGLIHVMMMLNDPSKLGEGIAVAFISYVYGALLAGILPNTGRGQPQKLTLLQLFVPGLALIGSFFVIMYAISQH